VIPVTSGGRKTWLLKEGKTAVKRLFIPAALGLYLAAHGVVGFVSMAAAVGVEEVPDRSL
jgi:hypothetical protein